MLSYPSKSPYSTLPLVRNASTKSIRPREEVAAGEEILYKVRKIKTAIIQVSLLLHTFFPQQERIKNLLPLTLYDLIASVITTLLPAHIQLSILVAYH